MIWLALLLPSLGFGASLEDRLYEALRPAVKRTERGFRVFHWERSDTDFAKKYGADTPEGLHRMVQEASRSFLEEDATKGFYTALDPQMSRAFGRDNWRLIQIEVPADWKYLDVRGGDAMEKVYRDFPEETRCLGEILTTNNHMVKANQRMGVAADSSCRSLKKKLFRRLGVSGVRYTWLPNSLGRYCRGSDRSAFIFTDGGWIKKSSLRSYTVDSREDGDDRRAIQEMVNTLPPPRMYARTKPAPLWGDLPKEKGISASTREWMGKHLLSCGSPKASEVEDEEEPDESEKAAD